MEQYIVYVFIGIAVLVAIGLFAKPMKWLLKLAVNTVLGFIGLFVFNWLGSYIGLSLGINIINAAVVGVLGLPGLVLLLFLKWVFMI